MTVALIDADIIAYEAGYTAEEAIDWSGEDKTGDWSLTANLPKAVESVRYRVQKIMEATEADECVLCLSDKANFRRDVVYSDYKSKRNKVGKASRKPLLLVPLLEFMVKEYETTQRPGLEADDCLGILATYNPKKWEDTRLVIASIDKDLMTVPGWHFNWRKPELGVFEVSLAEADLTFYSQVLIGDSTDNYPGCPGVGKVGAAKVMEAIPLGHRRWPAIVATYALKNLTELHAIQQARCARILRAEDYDFKKKEVILWLPPT